MEIPFPTKEIYFDSLQIKIEIEREGGGGRGLEHDEFMPAHLINPTLYFLLKISMN